MGLIREKDLNIRYGEFPMGSGEVWFGGSPLAIDVNGNFVTAKANRMAAANGDSTACRFIGIAWTTSVEVAKTKGSIASAIGGPCLVTLCKLTKATADAPYNYSNPGGTPGIDGDDFPYDVNVVFNVTDNIFINNSGLYTNVATNGGDPFYGFVRAKASDSLQVVFYGAPMYK